MRMNFGLSLFQLSLLIIFYALLTGVFSLNTFYYYSYQYTGWLLYFCAITIVYIYVAYHSITRKPNSGAVLLIVSLVIGYMPFEVNIPVAIELIKSPATNLNGLAEKMHLALVILVKMTFYPIITAIPFALMQFTIENKQESHPN